MANKENDSVLTTHSGVCEIVSLDNYSLIFIVNIAILRFECRKYFKQNKNVIL